MQYFANCNTLDELKAEYKRLARIHHPDVGGDCATMQQINAQYEAAFNSMKRGEAGSSETAKAETAAEFIAVIDALMKIKGITVELCGSWLWISGSTKEAKEALKAAGCRWASKKMRWYWHQSGSVARRGGRATMEHIRSKYGSRILSGESGEDGSLRMV